MKNVLPEDMPGLTESECALINLFRTFPPAKQKAILKAVFQAAMHGSPQKAMEK